MTGTESTIQALNLIPSSQGTDGNWCPDIASPEPEPAVPCTLFQVPNGHRSPPEREEPEPVLLEEAAPAEPPVPAVAETATPSTTASGDVDAGDTETAEVVTETKPVPILPPPVVPTLTAPAQPDTSVTTIPASTEPSTSPMQIEKPSEAASDHDAGLDVESGGFAASEVDPEPSRAATPLAPTVAASDAAAPPAPTSPDDTAAVIHPSIDPARLLSVLAEQKEVLSRLAQATSQLDTLRMPPSDIVQRPLPKPPTTEVKPDPPVDETATRDADPPMSAGVVEVNSGDAAVGHEGSPSISRLVASGAATPVVLDDGKAVAPSPSVPIAQPNKTTAAQLPSLEALARSLADTPLARPRVARAALPPPGAEAAAQILAPVVVLAPSPPPEPRNEVAVIPPPAEEWSSLRRVPGFAFGFGLSIMSGVAVWAAMLR